MKKPSNEKLLNGYDFSCSEVDDEFYSECFDGKSHNVSFKNSSTKFTRPLVFLQGDTSPVFLPQTKMFVVKLKLSHLINALIF